MSLVTNRIRKSIERERWTFHTSSVKPVDEYTKLVAKLAKASFKQLQKWGKRWQRRLINVRKELEACPESEIGQGRDLIAQAANLANGVQAVSVELLKRSKTNEHRS